jgi:hypothetical protein
MPIPSCLAGEMASFLSDRDAATRQWAIYALGQMGAAAESHAIKVGYTDDVGVMGSDGGTARPGSDGVAQIGLHGRFVNTPGDSLS